MKVCVISDTHDRVEYLHAAIEDAKVRGAEIVLHCGDLIAPYTLRQTHTLGLPIHVIHGNNKGDLAAMCRLASKPESLINYHGRDASLEMGGKKIFLIHFPEYAEAMALTGKWDLICCGHNHRCKIESIRHADGDGSPLLVNPGSASGLGRVQPTYVFGNLETMEFEIIDIQEPELPPYRSCR